MSLPSEVLLYSFSTCTAQKGSSNSLICGPAPRLYYFSLSRGSKTNTALPHDKHTGSRCIMPYISLERSSKIPTAGQIDQDSEIKAYQNPVHEQVKDVPTARPFHPTCLRKGDWNQLLLSFLHLQRVAAVTKAMWEGKWQITMSKEFLEFDNFSRRLPTSYFISPCFYRFN